MTKPAVFYSLRIVNDMAAIMSMADALSTGVMAASESRWMESLSSDRTDLVLMLIHLVVLCRECTELILKCIKIGGRNMVMDTMPVAYT